MKARREWADLSVKTTLDNIPKNKDIAKEMQDNDPLLALAGTLECEMTDMADTMPPEMRETNTDEYREMQGIDPLLALAGTLKGSTTDMGERHDDYIGDALLAELRGDNDESDPRRYQIRKCISKSNR